MPAHRLKPWKNWSFLPKPIRESSISRPQGVGSPPHLGRRNAEGKGRHSTHSRSVQGPRTCAPGPAGRANRCHVSCGPRHTGAYPIWKAGERLELPRRRAFLNFKNVPVIAESYPGFVATTWFAVVAPPKTPPAIVEKLSQAIVEAHSIARYRRTISRWRHDAGGDDIAGDCLHSCSKKATGGVR